MANVPPLFLERKIFRTLQPCLRIRQPCLSEVIENVTNRFLVQKTVEPNFWVSLTLTSGFTVILRFSRKKFQRPSSPFKFLQFPSHGKSKFSHSFVVIGMRFDAFYSQLESAIICWNGFSNFCLKIIYIPQKSKQNLN